MTEHITIHTDNISSTDAFIYNYAVIIMGTLVTVFILALFQLMIGSLSHFDSTKAEIKAKNIGAIVAIILTGIMFTLAGFSLVTTEKYVNNQSRDHVINMLENKHIKPVCDKPTNEVQNSYICGGDVLAKNKVIDTENNEEYDFKINSYKISPPKSNGDTDIKVTYTIE